MRAYPLAGRTDTVPGVGGPFVVNVRVETPVEDNEGGVGGGVGGGVRSS